MRDLIERLKQEVGRAREAGNIPALMATANAAIDALEQAASDLPEDERTAVLNAAKKFAYNSAADVWPGWELGIPTRTEAELQAGRKLAERCKTLGEQLAVPARQRGNAIWLIAAFELASGRYGEAAMGFQAAALAFEGETEGRLMAQGYSAIAAELAGQTAVTPGFDGVIDALAQLETEDSGFFKEQLRVARTLFPYRIAAASDPQ